MIKKLVFKILLKAMIPLVLMVGVSSYGLYAIGGDPLSVLKKLGGGFGDQVAKLTGSAGASFDAARKKTTSTLGSSDPGSAQTLYRWKDASGVTHFSSTPPADGATADEVKVNPNANLMAAPKAYSNDSGASASKVSHTNGLSSGNGEIPDTIPGMGGIMGQDMNPADLVKQFKAAQEMQQSKVP